MLSDHAQFKQCLFIACTFSGSTLGSSLESHPKTRSFLMPSVKNAVTGTDVKTKSRIKDNVCCSIQLYVLCVFEYMNGNGMCQAKEFFSGFMYT